MFSSIMETVLLKFLGKYVDGIKNNIDVSIINGDVSVEKVSVRPQFINELGLPFLLKYSHISKILINVPWTSLKQKPTTVTVQGIYVLLALKYDDMEEMYIDPASKLKPIIERVKQQIKKKWEEKQIGKDTFAEKSIIRIIDNLILNIDQIHVRVQSIKRNWDFSFGVIIDKMSSYTVNEYGQKMFYTRHFTNKQANSPLRKSFACQRFQIYFNDKEEFFMSLQDGKDKNQKIKTLLSQPFAAKNATSSPGKKLSLHKIPSFDFKQTYQMKNLSRFTFDFVIEQKLSVDKKYVVQVKGQLPKLNLQISDIQLSQIIVFLQLVYEWVVDKEKNGRRNNTFDEKTQQYFKSILIKLAKQDKVQDNQIKDLYKIVTENSIEKLEDAADNLIRDYRIQKEMKKINKVSNKQKSKQLMEKMFQRLQNQNKQVLQLFEHIIIEIDLPQFKLSCIKEDHSLLEVGLNSIRTQVKLVLTKHTLLTVNISQAFFKSFTWTQSKDLIIFDKPEYSAQPFMEFSMTKQRKLPPTIKSGIKKRYILFDQQTLQNLIIWISCVKMKPPLINFLDEQINYSIYITQQIFNGLFSHPNLSLNFNIEVPVLAIQLNSLVQYNLGTLAIKREAQDEYSIQITQKQFISVDGIEVLNFTQGNNISLLNIKPQTVKLQLKHLNLQNVPKIIKFALQFVKNPIIKQIKKIDPIVEQQVLFQGKFTLNQFKTPQNMMLKGNYLRFFPSGQAIYLLRTKMYPFNRKNRYGLIFRQQVQKQINIVLMNSQKDMYTLFQTLKQHMLYICTIAQWKKYYQKFSQQIITEVGQIPKQQQNQNLIDLHLNLNTADIFVGVTTQGETILNLNDFKGVINYKQYNTDAKGEIGGLNLTLGKQKLIQNLAIGVNYSYVDFMDLLIHVMMFKLNIQNYTVIEQIINQCAEYSLMIQNLVNTAHKALKPQFQQQKFIEEEVVSHNAQGDMEYLLQKKITIKLSNIQAFLIGFRNMIKTANLEVATYRNNPNPNISCNLKSIILMSCATLTEVQMKMANAQLDLELCNLTVYLSLQLVLYELTVGRGNYFINSIMNLIQTRKSMAMHQAVQPRRSSTEQKPMMTLNINIKGIKTRFKLTQNQELSTVVRTLTLKICQNQSDKHLIDISANWNKLSFVINNNIILEPISGKVYIKNTKQGLPVSANAEVEPIVVNISIHKLIQSALVIKISLQRVFNLQIVKSLLFTKLTAKNPGMNKKETPPELQMKIKSMHVILYSYKDWQLIRFKVDQINLDTHRGRDNEIQVSLQYLNPLFKIYEPVMEKIKIAMCIQEGPQASIKLDDVRINISQQFVRDILGQLLITRIKVEEALRQTKFHENLDFSTHNQLQKFKKIIINMIVPEYHYEEIEDQVKQVSKQQQSKINSCILFIRNSISCQALVDVKIDEQKTQLHLKPDQAPGEVKFKIRSQYNQSYEMIEKYKRILVKLTLIHPAFSSQSSYFSVFLHKQAYNYLPTLFEDGNGLQVKSAVGLYIHQQDNSSNYILQIVSPFKIVNTTTLSIYVNWIKGDDSVRNQLAPNESKWISPWVPDKININPSSQHIYASSYQILFPQSHGLYELGLNSQAGNQAHNFCCLTIERQLFQISYASNSLSRKSKKDLEIEPATFYIKPTYFVISHFHTPLIVNDYQCKHKQKVPLYSMFRDKKDGFFKLKFGDGSVHEVYLPKDGQTKSVELKLKNQNYITISILRAKSLQGTKSPQANQCIYHIYAQLQLLISFPKMQDISLYTNIYANKFKLKKQLCLQDIDYQQQHPSLIVGAQTALIRDRFHFNTYVNILGEYQKYLEVKALNFYSKQVTLYPSYYGDNIQFYRSIQIDPNLSQKQKQSNKAQSQLIYRKYSINYEFTKINNQITMYYVSILPKYYVLNLSSQSFNVDGQGILKFNERIVVDSDEVQIIYSDSNAKWEMMSKSMSVNLNHKKQIIFFKQILFKQHEINQALKNRRRRKKSKSLNQNQQMELLNSGTLKRPEAQPKQIKEEPSSSSPIKKSQSLSVSQYIPQISQGRIIIDTSNLKIFQILKHIGSYSATTFCIKEWNEWINIHNNLGKAIIICTSYMYDGLEISIETQVYPGQAGNHPYGIQNMPKIQFYIIGDNNQKLQLGCYETNMRLNDEIELIIPATQNEPPRTQVVVMYEARTNKGRKVIFSFMNSGEEDKNKSIKSLIIPAFLKISQSLKVMIQSVNASVIAGQQSNRKELFRVCSHNVDLTLLVYPSGLYMLQASCGLQIQAPQFRQYVLSVPSIEFYLQAIQSRFIERVTLKIPKQITAFLTDKLLYEILDVVNRNINEFSTKSDVFNTDDSINKLQDHDGFYTSSLNSVSIGQINAKVTMKKVLIEGSENQRKIRDMGLSIAQLEGSGIKLPKIDIDEPVNTKHLSNITKTYVMGIIVGCLGGMNLIGNPKQFMEEIDAGRMRGKPVIGLVGGVLAGTANSMSKVLSTVSNSFSNLSMDYEYQRHRTELYMNQPKGFVNGVKQGSKSLFSSVKSGLFGLVEKPIEGVKEEGGIGFFKGSLQGLVGLVVKPMTGLMDATSMTIQGIRSASSYSLATNEEYKGMEKPLYHKFRIIRPFDKIDQLTFNSLSRILRADEARHNQTIDLVQSMILQDEQGKLTQEAVVITAQKLYVINFCKDIIEMQIPNDKMIAAGKFLEGVVLYFQHKQTHQQTVGLYHRDKDESQIVFRIHTNALKKQQLFYTLKSFIGLYKQSKDNHHIPE